MAIGDPPTDIYHNGEWYSRSGDKLSNGVIKTFATLAALGADTATNYPRGGVVQVGPDAAGQYSEWFSNGARWPASR